jgi:hypothetical protein
MIRSVSLLLFFAISQAQEKPADPLASLRQRAEKTSADWEALAKGLESKIATLLPCDPKSRAAVEDVSRASDARLSALSAYMKAAVAKAKTDTDAAKRVLAAQASISGGWNTERDEAQELRSGIESQVADLKESMRKRGSLSGAEKVLVEIANMVNARAAKAEEQTGHRDTIEALLGDVVIAYQDRQTALEQESSLLDGEIAKWNSYYAARLARATTECAIINPTPPLGKKRP